LQRFFELFGSPLEDSENFDYLFLGNNMNFSKSLDLILFLFSLKAKYPDAIHLLRGRHDYITSNFEQECKEVFE